MKAGMNSFTQLVQLAMQHQQAVALRPVIEKELLHYDVLFCLDRAGLLDDLVFQGGMSLRLCYGANRLSEDLDFAGGVYFDSQQLAEMKLVIEAHIGRRYGLEVTVKEPKQLRQEPEYAGLRVDKWQVAVTTSPRRRDIPKQRIKIEVANVPAYTKQVRPLMRNYDFLPDGYEDVLVMAESLDEVMADKLVSLPATQHYIRYRDIWDLAWLYQQGAVLDVGLVAQKVRDYKLEDFAQMLKQRVQGIDALLNGGEFQEEMMRFIIPEVYERTIQKPKFMAYLGLTVEQLLRQLQKGLAGEGAVAPKFPM